MLNADPIAAFAEHLSRQGVARDSVQRDVAAVRRLAAWFETARGYPFDPARVNDDLLATYALEIQPTREAVGTARRTAYTRTISAIGRFFHWAASTGLLPSDPSVGLPGVVRAKLDREGRRRRRPADDTPDEQFRRLHTLNQISSTLNATLDLRAALDHALRLVVQLMGLETGWAFLTTDDPALRRLLAPAAPPPHHYIPLAAIGLPPALSANDWWPLREPPDCDCQWRFEQGELTRAVNIVECSRIYDATGDTHGLKFHASVPIISHKQRLGILNVATSDWGLFSAADLELLSAVGAQLGVAIERAQLFENSARLAQMEERNRLAREIHDTLAQGLTAISLRLEAADALLPNQPDRAGEHVRTALNLSRDSLEDVRRSVLDLRAAPLQDRTLPEALDDLVRQFSRLHGIASALDVAVDNRRFSARVEAGLYRIAQEALTNVARHAHAHRVDVRLAAEDNRLCLVVADDGRGFDLGALRTAQAEGHFGITGIHERAQLLGGALEIETAPGRGARIVVCIPLDAHLPRLHP